jgi:hypothetical protein
MKKPENRGIEIVGLPAAHPRKLLGSLLLRQRLGSRPGKLDKNFTVNPDELSRYDINIKI